MGRAGGISGEAAWGWRGAAGDEGLHQAARPKHGSRRAAWLCKTLQEQILGWPGTEMLAEERHPKRILRSLGECWDCSPPLELKGEPPAWRGKVPPRAPAPLGLSPGTGALGLGLCLGKHHRQSRACSAPRSLTPPHPQRGKNAEKKGKILKTEEGRKGKTLPGEPCLCQAAETRGGRQGPHGGLCHHPLPQARSSGRGGQGCSSGPGGKEGADPSSRLQEHTESRMWG